MEFHSKFGINPVAQDISDLSKHFLRRRMLTTALGLVPSLMSGTTVLEFGPGGGWNSLYLGTLKLGVFDLVEGNPRGVNETVSRLKHLPHANVHASRFEAFESSKNYDVVWAEGCLPHNDNPTELLRTVSQHVRPGGALVITLISAVSWLSEIYRRLVWMRFFSARCEYLLPNIPNDVLKWFEVHLAALPERSRPTRDWILDNMVQPLQNTELLGLPDALMTLGDDFEFYNSSPQFVTDWRWYIEVTEDSPNQRALEMYYRSVLNFVDRRIEVSPHSASFGQELEQMCFRSWLLMCEVQNGLDSLGDFIAQGRRIADALRNLAPTTSASILEASKFLLMDETPEPSGGLGHFASWWGRGQAYASFIRKAR